jgi:hypothetical protein
MWPTAHDSAELQLRRDGDKQKAQAARRLREQTPMTWDWIAQRLRMGTSASAANRVRAVKGQ